MLDWLAQPQGPHLVDGMSTENPLTALAILIASEALYDSDSPMVELGLIYKAPYIQTTSWTEAYFDLKLASQAKAGNRPTGAKVIFVQIQASSQVIPLPGVPTLFLDVKTLRKSLTPRLPNPHKTLGASSYFRSSSRVGIHRQHGWPFLISRVKQSVAGSPGRNRCYRPN